MCFVDVYKCTHMTESVRTPGKTARLFVRTSESELASWKTQAASEGKLLSEWVCETLNGQCGPEVMPTESDKTTGLAVETGEHRAVAVTSAKKQRECVHGRGAGFNCWQCGGLAKI